MEAYSIPSSRGRHPAARKQFQGATRPCSAEPYGSCSPDTLREAVRSTRLLGLVVLKIYWAGITSWPGLQFPWCSAAGRAGVVSPCRSIFQAEGPRLGLEASTGVSEWACGEAGWGGDHHVEAGEPRHRKQENGNSERVTSGGAEGRRLGKGPVAAAGCSLQRSQGGPPGRKGA